MPPAADVAPTTAPSHSESNEKVDQHADASSGTDSSLRGPDGELYVQSQGVTRIEAVHRAIKHERRGKGPIIAVAVSIFLCAFAYSLDSSTTYNYEPLATSDFQNHSGGLATLSIATSIISAVSKPFVAKIADITSRPYTYTLILFFYVVGSVIIVTCKTISAYYVGAVFSAIGQSGLDLLNDIIVGDLTPLEWRGLISSLLGTPFIVNTWYAAEIFNALSGAEQWRWGYGMFAIIMPVCLTPAIVVLIYLERRAKKDGIVNIASSNAARRLAAEAALEKGEEPPRGAIVAEAIAPKLTWWEQLRFGLIEIDAFGLILLGFGWSLLLLPFSLKTTAVGGWENPSMIAMMVVGGVLLITYVLYEYFISPLPSFPRRLLYNKTFLMAIIIDSVYFVAGNLRSLYYSSFTYVTQDWTSQEWVYFGNTTTISLCVFGVVAGLLQRWTHRYKLIQVLGLCIKIIGVGISLRGHGGSTQTGAIVMSQILIGWGGAFSVVGSRVASQASVPHQDMATVIALLSLWSKIGGSIGSAAAVSAWSHWMPLNLKKYIPGITDAEVKKYYLNIRTIKTLAFDSPVRQGAIIAYRETLYYLIVPAICLSFIPLVASLFQTNYYLGKQQNAVMNVGLDGKHLKDERVPEPLSTQGPATTFKEKLLRFWAGGA